MSLVCLTMASANSCCFDWDWLVVSILCVSVLGVGVSDSLVVNFYSLHFSYYYMLKKDY